MYIYVLMLSYMHIIYIGSKARVMSRFREDFWLPGRPRLVAPKTRHSSEEKPKTAPEQAKISRSLAMRLNMKGREVNGKETSTL